MFPGGIGLRDPRSQKRDLGHPSISPFDIAEGTSFVISLPTRLSESAAPQDDKGKGNGSIKVSFGTEAFFKSNLDRSEVQPSLRDSFCKSAGFTHTP